MPHEDWSQAQRLLLVQTESIGDVVMLTPVLRTLRSTLPQARITLLTSPAGTELAPLLPWVDEVRGCEPGWETPPALSPRPPEGELQAPPRAVDAALELIRDLQHGRFDAALIFTSAGVSPYPAAALCYLAGIRLRAAQSRESGGQFLTHLVRPLPDQAHQVDRNLWLLAELGLPIDDRAPELVLSGALRRRTDTLLQQHGIDPDSPLLAIAPGARAEARIYPPELFAEAAIALAAETGLPAVLLGDELDRRRLGPAFATAAARRGVCSLLGETSLAECAGVVARSSLVLSAHAAVMHIADALGRPVVALFSGVDREEQWAPLRARARLLREPTPCAPCHHETCPYTQSCLDVPPAVVVREALDLLYAASGDRSTAPERASAGMAGVMPRD